MSEGGDTERQDPRELMAKKLSQIGEFGLIGLLRRQFAAIGDDTAVLPLSKDKFQLFTMDMIVEGAHFTLKSSPKAIGHKAMACNISDIAAMGGVPTFAVVSLGVSAQTKVQFVKDLYGGMQAVAKKFNVAIVGGDTVKSNKLIINVALLGEVPKSRLVTRSGAKPGDWIFVTGPLGGSLKSGRHLTFTPRIKEAQFLAKFQPTSMIDISDGLAADLGHILEESNVGAVIYEHKIPRHPGVSLPQALSDGEDFELLFTVPPQSGRKLLNNKRFFLIGEIVDRATGLKLVTRKWKKVILSEKGYKHF